MIYIDIVESNLNRAMDQGREIDSMDSMTVYERFIMYPVSWPSS